MIKYKKYLFIALAVLIIAALFYWFKGKTKTISAIPDDNQPGANESLTEAEKSTVKTLATSLFNDLNGVTINIFGRDAKPYTDLATASDRVTVGTYNYFNENFGGGRTLLSWIKGDIFSSTGASGNAVLLIYEKFNRLNLI